MGIIYIITNKINGKCYVGQTIQKLSRRWNQHINNAKRGLDYLIYRAIRKYGIDNFIIEEVECTDSIEKLNYLESKYIIEYNTIEPNGYNLDSGGNNFKRRPSTGYKISKAKLGKPSKSKGVTRSEETKKKLSIARLGKRLGKHKLPMSLETRKKLSIIKKGKPGIPHTDEFKKKLSERNMGNQYSTGRIQSDEEKEKRSIISQKRKRDINGKFLEGM